MRYDYGFTEPALHQFQQLEPWLGEDTVDELDALADAPTADHLRSPAGFMHDFVRSHGNATYYVFLTVLPDVSAKNLLVTSVGVYIRQF